MHRIARRTATLAGALALCLPLTLAPAASALAGEQPTPGGGSAGDRLFPGLGNTGYDVRHYDLSFDYDAATRMVAMTAGVEARANHALSRFNLDFDGNTISRLTVNGEVADYRRDGAELIITPQRPIRDHRMFRVDVTYTADPRADHSCPLVPPLTGSAWLPTDDGFGLAGQPNCEHSAYPSNDIPSDKATYTITVATPEDLQSVANGTLVSTTHNDGKVIRTFDSPDPIASELVQVAVGHFTVYRHRAGDLRLRDVVPTELFADSKALLDKERAHISFTERQIGRPYPFDEYGSLGLEASFGFALENQTISLYPAGLLTSTSPFAETIMVHELTHQWFGDSVAPATWSDLWQNEGHATWYEIRYGQKLGVENLTDAMHETYTRGDVYREAFGPVAMPTSSRTMFSDQAYNGGALVLYALRAKVGKVTFRKIERRWVTKYADSTAGTDDFIALASQVANRDLRGFLEDWLYGTTTPPMPGHPGWHVDPPSDTAVAAAVARAQHGALAAYRR